MARAVTRVAVIGAGASGLAQLKQLLDTFARPGVPTELEVVVFESRGEIGGTWLFHPDKPYVRGQSEDGGLLYFTPPGEEDPSPMYEGLVTNLPSDLMSFRELPFTLPDSPAFPTRATILRYLQDYAEKFDLIRHIRFSTLVTRLYQPHGTKRWTIESSSGGESQVEEFDHVSVANGHYSDPYIPEIPGLSTFPGQILHSRFYTRPEDYRGKTILVVGSFASGSDVSRQLGSLNIGVYDASPDHRPITPGAGEQGYTKVYQSASSAPSSFSPAPGDPPKPWQPYIQTLPLITHLAPPSTTSPRGEIHFDTHAPIDDVDVIIFATGYNFALPFCKQTDSPWADKPLFGGVISKSERRGGRAGDVGGLKGLEVKHLDELMLFLDGDRSIAFPVLQYQIVPFPLAEVQGRLISRLWAGLLKSFPEHPHLPPNPSNPYHTPPQTPPSHPSTPKPLTGLEGEILAQPKASQNGEIRKAVQFRKKLVFGDPYEWTYEEHLISLMAEAGETEEYWKAIEPWRKERRADKSLRVRTLGW